MNLLTRWLTGPNRRLRLIPVAVLLSLMALLAVERLATYGKPLDRDIMTYAVIGHEMLAGRPLYSDLWDHKPPAIYATYAAAESLAGYGPRTIYLLSLAAAVISLFGVYFAGSAGGGGGASGLWAAAFWAVISCNINLDAGSPNAEVFINACLIWAFALLVRADSRSSGLQRWLAIGALVGAASLYKHVAVSSAILLGCAHVAFPPAGLHGRRRAVYRVLVAAAVCLAVWAGVFGYFAATGRRGIFLDTILAYNRSYAGDLLANLFAPLSGRARVMHKFLVPLAALAGGGLLLGLLKNPRPWVLWAAFAVASWVEIALPGRFWPHYYQLWLPALAVGAGWAVGVLKVIALKRRYAWLPPLVAAVLLAALCLYELRLYQISLASNWSRAVEARWPAADKLAAEVDQILMPGETFYLWGVEPHPYFRTGRRAPSGVLLAIVLFDGPFAPLLSARAAADLARERPELLIVERDIGQPELFVVKEGAAGRELFVTVAGHPVIDWLTGHYRPIPGDPARDHFFFFARRGGKLEARMEAARTKVTAVSGGGENEVWVGALPGRAEPDVEWASDLSHSPELNGLRLGMSVDQVKARFPAVVVESTTGFGPAVVRLNADDLNRQASISSSLGRAEGGLLKLEGGRVTEVVVEYGGRTEWRDVAEFASVISRDYILPHKWKTVGSFISRRTMRCAGFHITAVIHDWKRQKTASVLLSRS